VVRKSPPIRISEELHGLKLYNSCVVLTTVALIAGISPLPKCPGFYLLFLFAAPLLETLDLKSADFAWFYLALLAVFLLMASKVFFGTRTTVRRSAQALSAR